MFSLASTQASSGVSSAAVKRTGGTTMPVVNLGLARDTLGANSGEYCLALECFSFRIQENHSFNRQSPVFSVVGTSSRRVPRPNIHKKFRCLWPSLVEQLYRLLTDTSKKKELYAFSWYVFLRSVSFVCADAMSLKLDPRHFLVNMATEDPGSPVFLFHQKSDSQSEGRALWRMGM